jgi:ribosome-binding ATPase
MIVGVVGKANVGKSTFFKASTLAEVEIANYPFATIDPNTGVGHVKVKDPAKDFDKVSNPRNGFVINDSRFVGVQMIDVAGLVPGAHLGHGMGNQFLDDLRQADVLIHVIDVAGTTNEKGESITPGSYDPANDVRFLEVELDMWYLGILKKGWEKFARTVMQEKREIHIALGKQLSGLKVTEDMIADAIKELGLDKDKPNAWEENDLKNIAIVLRKKTKPMIIACNKIDVLGAKESFDKLKLEFTDHTFIACSAESELALREAAKAELIEYVPGEETFLNLNEEKMNEKQKAALNFIRENILEKFGTTGVQQTLDKAVFELLEYIAIFPGGVSKLEDSEGRCLPDCFLMPPKTTALDFAYKLHTDFGKKFICAKDVRTKMTVGKEHLLKHMDIVEIVAGK